MEDLPAEEQREAVSALLRPLLAQMEEQLATAGKATAGARTHRHMSCYLRWPKLYCTCPVRLPCGESCTTSSLLPWNTNLFV